MRKPQSDRFRFCSVSNSALKIVCFSTRVNGKTKFRKIDKNRCSRSQEV